MRAVQIDESAFLSLHSTGLSNKSIAKSLNVTRCQLERWMRNHGYESSYAARRQTIHTIWQVMYDKGASDREIADATGESPITVAAWRRANDLPLTTTDNIPKREMLWEIGATDSEIAEHTGESRETITSWRSNRRLTANKAVKLADKYGDEFARCYELGYTDQQTADACDVGRDIVRQWRVKTGRHSK